jgi:hypothetical protein
VSVDSNIFSTNIENYGMMSMPDSKAIFVKGGVHDEKHQCNEKGNTRGEYASLTKVFPDIERGNSDECKISRNQLGKLV